MIGPSLLNTPTPCLTTDIMEANVARAVQIDYDARLAREFAEQFERERSTGNTDGGAIMQ